MIWLLFRASFPAIFGSFRILYDIGWTYVILAEMVNARKGVGYMVEAARKVLDFERVYAGIIAIGVAAFLFRIDSDRTRRPAFPWQRPAGHRPSRLFLPPMEPKNKISIRNVSRVFTSATGESIQALRDVNLQIVDELSTRTAVTSASSMCCLDHPAAENRQSCG